MKVMVIMIMTMIFQAVTTIMLLFLEQVPQVNNGSLVYLPGLLEMNTNLYCFISQEMEATQWTGWPKKTQKQNQ